MSILLSALLLLTVRASTSEDLIVFDNFDYGEMIYGSEDKMVDYALLSLDKRTDLPDSFTICSSVHLNFVTSSIYFYQLYQDDGEPWFSFYIRANRDLNGFQEKIIIRTNKLWLKLCQAHNLVQIKFRFNEVKIYLFIG